MSATIRHFMWSDIEGIARVHRAAEPIDHAGRVGDAATLAQRWQRPGSAPEEVCLVAEARGAVIGYAQRSLPEGTTQCLVDVVVHPVWRRHGVGRRLLSQLAVEARLAGAHTLDMRARDDYPATLAFCQAMGFYQVRIWQRMWLEPLRVPPYNFPQGYSWRCFRPHQDEAAYAGIVNDTFSEHWGVGPTTVERVVHMVSQPEFEPDSVIFATCQRDIVGVSAVRFLMREVKNGEFTTAHIGPVGVRAAHRGLGLAHALLAASLRQCRRHDIQAAELDVDENNAPAIHVYRDCGFEPLFHTLWYRRDLMEGNHVQEDPAALHCSR